jgi:hypothetical protein
LGYSSPTDRRPLAESSSQTLRSQTAQRLLQAFRSCAVVLGCLIALFVTTLLSPLAVAASTISRTLPGPAMAIGGQIYSSSCVTGPVCVSLGWNHHGNTSYVWAARWQNDAWSSLPAPPKDNVTGDGNPTISCTTKQWCMTTGSTGSNAGSDPVADELTGTKWKSLHVPTPKGSTDFSLFELACQSSKWCVGVGSYVASKPNYTDATFLVSEVWNGSKWRMVPIFSPRTYAAQIDPGFVPGGEHPTAAPQQLSCVSTRFCVFTGFWTGVFVEEWNGHRWSEVVAPDKPNRPASDSEFSGGACASKSFCFAAGGYAISNAAWAPLLEQWNGHAWRIVGLPDEPKVFQHGNGFRLNRVECASSKLCVVFGELGSPSSGINGMRWNGKSWSYVSTGSRPSPAVVCLTKSACVLNG